MNVDRARLADRLKNAPLRGSFVDENEIGIALRAIGRETVLVKMNDSGEPTRLTINEMSNGVPAIKVDESTVLYPSKVYYKTDGPICKLVFECEEGALVFASIDFRED